MERSSPAPFVGTTLPIVQASDISSLLSHQASKTSRHFVMNPNVASPGHLSSTDDGDMVTPTLHSPDEKSVVDAVGIPTCEPGTPKDFPWTWKATALISGIALSWGSSFSENTLGPLKSTLKSELDITNAQVRSSSTFLRFDNEESEAKLTLCSMVQ